MPDKPGMFILLIPMLIFSLTGKSYAKTWIVSPNTDKNGCRPAGAGTEENPWDLQTALRGAGGQIKPGDTIFIHEGLAYWGYLEPVKNPKNGKSEIVPRLYECTLNGNPGAPVIVKAFPGEKPVIDCGPNSSPAAFKANADAGMVAYRIGLVILGNYTWIWGMTITNSDLKRECHDPSGFDIHLLEAINVRGDHDKLINLIIHDNTSTGISAFSGATNAELEGCLIYYNGMVAIKSKDPNAPEGVYKKNGPGIYTQNNSDGNVKSKKVIKNNVIFQQFYNGVQVYGSERAFTDGIDFLDNTVFNNGLIAKTSVEEKMPYADYNIVFGGEKNAFNNNFSRNQCCYFTTSHGKGNVKFGYNEYFQFLNGKIDSNYFISGVNSPDYCISPLLLNNLHNCSFSHNFIYSNAQVMLYYRMKFSKRWSSDISGAISCDANDFIYPDFCKPPTGYFQIKKYGTDNRNESVDYKPGRDVKGRLSDSFGLYRNSNYEYLSAYKKRNANALTRIYTKDSYEPGLVKLVIFNWDSLSEINISPGNFIPAGNEYRIIDIQNYLQGKPFNGFFTGNISIRMTGLKSDVPFGIKENPTMVMPEHTDARFGVYWLEYFPYSVKPELNNGKITCVFKDISGKEVKYPPFLTLQWKKNGKILPHEKGIHCASQGDGKYECIITDDHSLTKTLKFIVTGNKIAN